MYTESQLSVLKEAVQTAVNKLTDEQLCLILETDQAFVQDFRYLVAVHSLMNMEVKL